MSTPTTPVRRRGVARVGGRARSAPPPWRGPGSDLLAVVQREALDPDYAAAARGPRPARRRWMGIVGIAAATALLTMAGVQTSRSAPVAQTERNHLIDQVRAEQAQVERQRASVAGLQQQVDRLRAEQLPAAEHDASGQAALAGQLAVTGPGLVVVVDDAPGQDGARVADADLRRLVNGLWQAEAEAVAINGHRITSRTAIRSAGSAITVDYRSLNRPYRVEAVGNPRTLAGAFAQSSGGQWWSFLHDNYGYAYEVRTAQGLVLPSDPGLGVRVARVDR